MARVPLPLSLTLDPEASAPLHAQVREALRAAILDRRLPPGSRLPASRVLAADLGCARGTVILALEQLAAEGYLAARPGSGTRVAARLPDEVPAAPAPAPGRPAPPPLLSRRGARLAEAPARRYMAGPGVPDAFALGRPAADAFPFEVWARLLQAEWRHGPPERPDPRGSPALRRALGAYLAQARGIACEPDAVIVTAGIRQSLRLLAELLLDPGEVAAVEEPGFPGIAQALAGAGLRTVPVPVGPGGLCAADVAARAPGARLAVVTPAHHYPLGHAMSLRNRLDLLAWAEAAGGWIVEDDYDGAYRYAGRPLTPLRGLDRAARVVYVGSLSKVLLPALGLSYLVLPRGLVAPVDRALAETGPVPPPLGQWALARFIEEGHLAAHLRRTRRLYAARQTALVEAAATHAADVLAVAPMEGGMHLVARPGPAWRFGPDDRRAAAALAAAGLSAVALSAYHAGPPEPGLLLGYAAVPERAIEPAVRRMAAALRLTPPGASG
ncbi:PLP-dependent aminotransferase family protein [Methylobacterium sp. NEAU 140]|uniref:MocR-like pyridoxine biosynthesis transcription factor PdxR n=1 Tax=Methylobacterium sp. NEAU 140 TaxID=3064945 RepID=UPI002735348A|nr:PLP-dependent aminotransferase family protein [Methylobacterium sp. NEAU 140]MDP4025912.1 PLP-dependent aminotransferase family protein [Methylobacterium sp. NEAU 140]